MTTPDATGTPQEQRSKLFGSLKAEWLREQIFELFAEPSYFPELATRSPCILLGGRGTGKTTVLRCMSYEGRYELSRRDAGTIPEWAYYGMYYRVNTNRVTAFKGPELKDERWVRTFAHYMNLVFCDLAIRFLQWYQLHCETELSLGPDECQSISRSLKVEPANTLASLAKRINETRIEFESYINNVAEADPISLSLQGAPLDELFSYLLNLEEFEGKSFFFLLDEYENFENYQQQILNTLVKHSGELYSFKIGVRELGLRMRSTLNENEQLISPADYIRINIADKLEGDRFEAFAKSVCNERIRRLEVDGTNITDVSELLAGLTENQEAKLLDEGKGTATKASDELRRVVPKKEVPLFNDLPLLNQYCMVTWARNQNEALTETWRGFVEDPSAWEIRFTNYAHSLLFTLRAGKRGIRKYYCGMRVFTQMAAANIRYFLELVDQSLAAHAEAGYLLNEPIDPRHQTVAAHRVGRKNLSELEGVECSWCEANQIGSWSRARLSGDGYRRFRAHARGQSVSVVAVLSWLGETGGGYGIAKRGRDASGSG